MRNRFSEAVEQLTSRRVVGFLSQVGADPDIAIEPFWLEPDNQLQKWNQTLTATPSRNLRTASR